MKKHKNAPILYLDFLGFSEKILSQDIEKSIEYYDTIVRDLKILSNSEKFNIKIDIVSDSAFIWVDSKNTFESVLELFRIASTISVCSLYLGRPIRGSIVFDEFYIGDVLMGSSDTKISRTHLVLGKAIINGYRWEQSQDWFGISLNPIYINKLNDSFPGIIKNLLERNWIVYYDVPTKLGKIKSYAVNGFKVSDLTGTSNVKIGDKVSQIEVYTCEKIFDEYKAKIKDFSILVKLTNTEKYFEYIYKNGFFCEI